MAATITMPAIAPAGLPDGVKDSLRADFRTPEFIKMVERGYRLVWQRAARCPCSGINTQTDQPDPNCTLCKGIGWIYFGPSNYVVDNNAGVMTDSQKEIVSLPGAVVIRGIMTGVQAIQNAADKIGPWTEGTSIVTVRHENKLGFYDKIVNLDSEIVYNQVLHQGPTNVLAARYPIIGVNLLRSLTKVYTPDVDFVIRQGKINWVAQKAPPEKTTLTLHYLIHPTWIVVEHPRSARAATIKKKQRVLDSPMGSYTPLPIQAIVKYDFLAFG